MYNLSIFQMDDESEENMFDEQIRQLSGMDNPLNHMPNNDVQPPSIHVPIENQLHVNLDLFFVIDGDMQLVWGTNAISKSDVECIIRDTELEPTSLPITFLKYLLCMELIYG